MAPRRLPKVSQLLFKGLLKPSKEFSSNSGGLERYINGRLVLRAGVIITAVADFSCGTKRAMDALDIRTLSLFN